jgi:hypothetical protein
MRDRGDDLRATFRAGPTVRKGTACHKGAVGSGLTAVAHGEKRKDTLDGVLCPGD